MFAVRRGTPLLPVEPLLSHMNTRDLTISSIAGRNADGGWGYYRQQEEPAGAHLLGGARAHRDGHDAAPPAGAALAQWPARDGLLLERAGGEPNYAFHALALLALHAAALEHRDGNGALVDGLQRVKGLALGAVADQPAGQQHPGLVLD